MKCQWLIGSLIGISVLLSGCATPWVTSNVTTFHEWPSDLRDKTYVFERTKEQDGSLEYRNYENLVRAELQRLGFVEASALASAKLKAILGYSIEGRDVRVIEPVIVDPYWPGMYWPHPYWHGPYRYGYFGPFYDPFWYGPQVVGQRDIRYTVFTRQLRFSLSSLPNGKKLYETTVISEGREGNLATVMPYLIRSAFSDFPGKNGVMRRVELPMAKK